MESLSVATLKKFLFRYVRSLETYSGCDFSDQLCAALVISSGSTSIPQIVRYSFDDIISKDCLGQLSACMEMDGLGIVIGEHDLTYLGGSVVCSARLAMTAMILGRTSVSGILCIGYCDSMLHDDNFKKELDASLSILESLRSIGDIAFIYDAMMSERANNTEVIDETSDIFYGLKTDVMTSEIFASDDVCLPKSVEEYYIKYSDYAYIYSIYSCVTRTFRNLVDRLTDRIIGRVMIARTSCILEIGEACIGDLVPEIMDISFSSLKKPHAETPWDYFLIRHVKSERIDRMLAEHEASKHSSLDDIKSTIEEIEKIWLFLLTPFRKDIFEYHYKINTLSSDESITREKRWELLANFIKKLIVERRDELAADDLLTAFSLGVSVDDLFPKQVQEELYAELRAVPSCFTN